MALNTLYYDSIRSTESEIAEGIDEIGVEEFDWLRDQFKDDDNGARKFILISHVYPGARYKDF